MKVPVKPSQASEQGLNVSCAFRAVFKVFVSFFRFAFR